MLVGLSFFKAHAAEELLFAGAEKHHFDNRAIFLVSGKVFLSWNAIAAAWTNAWFFCSANELRLDLGRNGWVALQSMGGHVDGGKTPLHDSSMARKVVEPTVSCQS